MHEGSSPCGVSAVDPVPLAWPYAIGDRLPSTLDFGEELRSAIITMYREMPASLRGHSQQRYDLVVQDASRILRYKGHVLHVVLADDVTADQIRNNGSFWSRDPPNVALFFLEALEIVLGNTVRSNAGLWLALVGPFRDFWEVLDHTHVEAARNQQLKFLQITKPLSALVLGK